MQRTIKWRAPSPALVISMIALFVAISGVAVALPGKNSVTTDDIKKNAVTSSDIRNNNVKGADVKESTLGVVPNATHATNADNATAIAANSVNSGKVADNSLTGADINEGTLGPTLPITYARRENGCQIAEGTQGSCTATCPAGLNAIGGGIVAEGNHNEQIFVNGSRFNPNDGPATGWTGFLDNNADLVATSNNFVTPYVICTPAASTAFTEVTG
jgi:hypothetical protein